MPQNQEMQPSCPRRFLTWQVNRGNVLRDEANLEGLYPPTKIAPTTPDGKHRYHSAFGGVRREERVTKLLLAEADKDFSGRRLVEQASPYVSYVMPDTSFPVLMLNVAAMTHIMEQLDAIAIASNAVLHATLNDEDPMWLDIAQLFAHRFRVQRDAWAAFSDGLRGVGDHLVKGNYDGHAMEMYGDRVCAWRRPKSNSKPSPSVGTSTWTTCQPSRTTMLPGGRWCGRCGCRGGA